MADEFCSVTFLWLEIEYIAKSWNPTVHVCNMEMLPINNTGFKQILHKIFSDNRLIKSSKQRPLNFAVLRFLILQWYYFHKLWERKVKTLARNWRDHKRTGTHKHTETVSRYFNWQGRLSQSKESKCLWTHDKDGVTREFTKGATRGLQEGWISEINARTESRR